MLHAERDSHDRDAEEKSTAKMKECDLPPSEDNPKDIADDREAARLPFLEDHLTSERTECIETDLDELDPERDADYRDAEKQSEKDVQGRRHKTAEDKPEKVSDKTHDRWKLLSYKLVLLTGRTREVHNISGNETFIERGRIPDPPVKGECMERLGPVHGVLEPVDDSVDDAQLKLDIIAVIGEQDGHDCRQVCSLTGGDVCRVGGETAHPDGIVDDPLLAAGGDHDNDESQKYCSEILHSKKD